jgi:hypothetical protein
VYCTFADVDVFTAATSAFAPGAITRQADHRELSSRWVDASNTP